MNDTNKERNQLKMNQLSMVKEIRIKHRVKKASKIQIYLKKDYSVDIGVRTICRYNKIIDKEKKKITIEKSRITKNKNKQIKQNKPMPDFIICPGCKSKFKRPLQKHVTLSCMKCGKTFHPNRNAWYDNKRDCWDTISKPKRRCLGVILDWRI